jgi:hypothetical protein
MVGAGDGEEGAESAQAQLRAAGFLRHGCFLSCCVDRSLRMPTPLCGVVQATPSG